MLVKDLSFRGKSYKITYLNTIPQHPSWYSFDDEVNVRDRDWHVNPGDVIMDVGAAYGSYTLTALLQGADFVWAWSPQGRPGEASEADFMRENLALNGWSNKCSIEESGVYSKDGWLNTMTQQFFETQPDPHPDIIRVSTLDAWMDKVNLQRVDWMKLDVEGAEVEVLTGAKNILSKFKPKIQVENHLFKRGSIADEVRQLLSTTHNQVSHVPYHSVSHSLFVPKT